MNGTTVARLAWVTAVVGALGVHVVSIASIALPAIPSTKYLTGLIGVLPTLRRVLLGLSIIGAVALLGLAIRRPRHRVRHALGSTLIGLLAATGTTYGCTTTVSVEKRPVATSERDSAQVFDHRLLDGVLATFVDAHGMVDYRGLKGQRAKLDEYVGQLAAASPRSHPALFPTEADRLAYWINAYNALMLRAVIDNYPVTSVKDIMAAHGVFNRLRFPVGGGAMTLDDIEKGILLKEFEEPRVHFALTCASMSCPRLDRRAFQAEGLSERLDVEGRDFLNSADGVVIDIERGQVRLSKYFDWYGADFGPDHVAYVRRLLTPERAAQLASMARPQLGYLEYDWRLNDQAAAWRAR